MVIALSIFGITYAAFCVWLTVRIVNRREKWAKWTAVALAVLAVVYAVSAGPLGWMILHGYVPNYSYDEFYSPLSLLWTYGPEPFRSVYRWYFGLWVS